ncbi:MAG: gephyrin-like molybdotransferase Glp [Alphaproteobacteria bacterium]
MLSVEEAHARLIAGLNPLAPETVPLIEATGRVLRADVVARRTQPAVAVSAMDGYAVRAADLADPPMVLDVIAAIPAGTAPPPQPIRAGQAARIFTGAALPDGADAIVVQEDCRTLDGGRRVDVSVTAEPGRHMRRAGLDFSAGDTLIPAGRVLDPAAIALAAAAGVPALSVTKRPAVAVLATGSELLRPEDVAGGTYGPHRTVASSLYGLLSALTVWGAAPRDAGIIPDDPDATRAALQASATADLVITLGGASVGDHDLVRDAVSAAGGQLDFWRIAMRPGKPLMVGTVGAAPFIGLPGNPVSAMVCATLFVRAAVDRLGGMEGHLPPLEDAIAGAAISANGPRQDYMRASFMPHHAHGTVVVPAPVQDSSMLRPLAQANVLLVRPPHAPETPVGAPCKILRLR